MPSVAQPRRTAAWAAPIFAATVAAAAAWLSQSWQAFTHIGGDRLVMLPLSPAAAAIVVFAGMATFLLVRRGASTAPLMLLVFLFLPWIPGDLPAAFFVWVGPLTLLVWAAVAVIVPASAAASLERRLPRAVVVPPHLAAGIAAFLLFGFCAWQVADAIPGGDEPHYLVITQSLLKDGDLRIENNHRRGDYQAYYGRALQPDFRRRGRDGQIYSIHPPGVSAFVAPAFAVGGYPAVIIFLLAIAAAGTALAWRLAWLATRRSDAAWFGWAAVSFSATWIFHSFTVYPDGPASVLVLTGLWALLRVERERETAATSVRPWLLHGTALAALPWFHTRFALLAGALGALILLRLATARNPAAKAVAFLAVPAVSAVAWIGYFIAIYGTPDPSAPYAGEAGSFSFVAGGLTGLLFDQRFGLFAYAPALAAGFVGLGIMVARRRHARLALEILFVLVPYLLTVTHFAMWWGGWSAPARFATPVLLLLVVPAAIGWTSLRSAVSRVTAIAALLLTGFASAVLVLEDGGTLAYNSIRESSALWLPRVSALVDLAAAFPLWSRAADWPLFRDTAIWLVALAGAWALARTLTRSSTPAQTWATAATVTTAIYMVAAMGALTVVWRVRDSPGVSVASAQMEMLRQISESPRAFAVNLDRAALVARDNIPGRFTIELSRELTSRAAARDDRPLFAIPGLPAGEYRISLAATEQRGWVMIGVGRDQFALRTEPLAVVASGVEMRFGVSVGELVIRGDEDARQVVRTLRLEPLALVGAPGRSTDAYSGRAVRYPAATVFFLDDGSFAEPEAFWVGGARRSSIVVQPDERPSALELLVRNAPVENRLTIESAGWREEIALAAGEERRVRVPLDPARDATLIELSSASGFRPSAVDPTSRDDRYLGVWIKVE